MSKKLSPTGLTINFARELIKQHVVERATLKDIGMRSYYDGFIDKLEVIIEMIAIHQTVRSDVNVIGMLLDERDMFATIAKARGEYYNHRMNGMHDAIDEVLNYWWSKEDKDE